MVPSKKVMDQRFAEKMRALKEGRAPVFVAEAPVSSDPIEAANARIREKIRRHNTKAAPVAEVNKTEETSKPKGEEENSAATKATKTSKPKG